ncbi:MAG: methyltransferase domain-containing protein [Terriglobia bacterium]
MSPQLPSTSLSSSEVRARQFYNHWMGGSSFTSVVGRLIFKLSGVVYSHTFIRVAGLNPGDKVLEIGCGMGTILTDAQRHVNSTESYLGIDLSHQMVLRGKEKTPAVILKPVELIVGSALSLPLKSALFDVVLMSHVIKYLTDDQLDVVLEESARVLKPGGRIVLWEFSPLFSPLITRLVVKYCSAQKLRPTSGLRRAMETAGYDDLKPFRIITPWLPWSNIAFAGRRNGCSGRVFI